MTFHGNGTGYIPVPGDLVVETNNTAGYVTVVDRIEGASTVRTVRAVEQNATEDGRHSYTLTGSTLTGARSTNGNPGTVRGVLHSPHNGATSTTTRESVTTEGGPPDNESTTPAISTDGRHIAFGSHATNLVPGDTNGFEDIFVRDRHTGVTTRVSVGAGGAQANSSSALPAISADGRYVAFTSHATNLVPGDTNNAADVFVHDRSTATTTRTSVATGGTQPNGHSYEPAISANGRYITFTTDATNLGQGYVRRRSHVFVHDRNARTTVLVSTAAGAKGNGLSHRPAISPDGRHITFTSHASNLVPGDTNGFEDIFVRDRQTATTTRVSVATDGTQTTGRSYGSAISADGRYVTFASYATNLVAGDTNSRWDVFGHDLTTGATTRLSVATTGTQGNNHSFVSPVISADGRCIVFVSSASNLVPDDTSHIEDVFVRLRG